MSYRMVTFANTPKGRAGLKTGDWLHFGVEPRGKLVPGGHLLRLDPDAYVLDDGGITIVVPFALVLYAMRASRK